MLMDVAYVGNKADDLLLVANYNQAVPEQSDDQHPAGVVAADLNPWTSPTSSTAARHGTRRSRGGPVARWGRRRRSSVRYASTRKTSAAPLENHNGTSRCRRPPNPDAASVSGWYHQPDNSTTELVGGAALRPRKAAGAKPALRWRSTSSWAAGSWAGGVNTITPGEMVMFTYSPAAPFQVSAITNDFSGANNYRPNITCDPYAPSGQQSITQWFNPACVVMPTDQSQPFGNAPRNNVRGPNFWQFDLAASKNVALGGQARLQLRLEAFNLFNRVNFTPPAANRSNSTFGTITGTFDQRQVQLGVKVLW